MQQGELQQAPVCGLIVRAEHKQLGAAEHSPHGRQPTQLPNGASDVDISWKLALLSVDM